MSFGLPKFHYFYLQKLKEFQKLPITYPCCKSPTSPTHWEIFRKNILTLHIYGYYTESLKFIFI